MINGIHHITALASDPQRNADFYTGLLGLRLVKRTVNFDAPDVYHLYYGDAIGQPGTILTFFPFPNAVRGKRGTGEISAVAFSVPKHSQDFWLHRLSSHGIHLDGPTTRFGDELISFLDPDGMMVELVFTDTPSNYRHWPDNPVPEEFAIRGIRGATMQLRAREETDTFLQTLGFTFDSQNGTRFRYRIGAGEQQVVLDMLVHPDLPHARQSAGSVHHIAWRVEDDASQLQWQRKIAGAGLRVTDVLDRNYFRSIYFREPGGVLFEIATAAPGFMVDEPLEELGLHLKLPEWLEPERPKLERILPPLELKKKQGIQA
jgi:glyoxalase family protein